MIHGLVILQTVDILLHLFKTICYIMVAEFWRDSSFRIERAPSKTKACQSECCSTQHQKMWFVVFWCLHCQVGPEPIISARDLADTVPNLQRTVQLPDCLTDKIIYFKSLNKVARPSSRNKTDTIWKETKGTCFNIHFTQD